MNNVEAIELFADAIVLAEMSSELICGAGDVAGAKVVAGAGDVAGADDVCIHLTCRMVGDGILKGVVCILPSGGGLMRGGGLTAPFVGGLIGGGLIAGGPRGISSYVD